MTKDASFEDNTIHIKESTGTSEIGMQQSQT